MKKAPMASRQDAPVRIMPSKAKTADAAGVADGLQGLKCAKTIVGNDNSCITYGTGNFEGAHHDPPSFLIMKSLKNGDWVPAS